MRGFGIRAHESSGFDLCGGAGDNVPDDVADNVFGGSVRHFCVIWIYMCECRFWMFSMWYLRFLSVFARWCKMIGAKNIED